MGPPPRACLFMTPARVPMSVPLLLEHVHGDPCPIVHAAVMSNRQRPGVRPRLRWRPRPCPTERTNPGPRPADRRARRRRSDGAAPRGGPYGPPDTRRVRRRPPPAACALRTGVGVPDTTGSARALHAGRAREISWSAGWFRGTRGVGGPGHPGGDRLRIHTFRSGPRGEEPAVRRPARPLKRRAPPPPAPDDRARRAEVSRCIRSRRRQPTPRCRRAAEPRGSGTPGPPGMGRSADPALPTSP